MAEESQHICVASARYYLKSESLVFVAIISGKVVATVEISLENYSNIQCRAFANRVSEYQGRIAEIINKTSLKSAREHNVPYLYIEGEATQ